MKASDYPISTWLIANPILHEAPIGNHVMMLHAAADDVNSAIEIVEQWGACYTQRSGPLPDLVACVAYYGHSRILTQDWTEFPIEVSKDKTEVWRESGLGASLFEFREERQGGVAGGWLEMAGKEPSITLQALQAQLAQKVARLKQLVAQPVEQYTPEEFTLDERAEMEDSADRKRIEEPFDILEQLKCFEYAFQSLRAFAITEHSPELGLPNKALYEALTQIDLNRLNWELDSVEGKLRAILEYLSSINYFALGIEFNVSFAPEEFWWRHVKKQKGKASGK